jgi:glycosyltransferase involved in cell wall biosynthesis
MQILFVGSFLSKSRGTKGVAETLADNLLQDGISIKLVSPFENKIIRIIHILFSILIYRGRIIHIDVFSGNAFIIAELASFLANLLNKQIIMTFHGGRLIEFADNNQSRVKKMFDRSYRIQTPSLFLRNYFLNLGYNIAYLPNSVPLDKFKFDRSQVKPYSLLWVRGFASIYNPLVPVKILVELLKYYPETTLTMVGPDKGLLKDVKDYALKSKVDQHITFTGGVTNDSLYKYYQTHAVYLNTTSYESFGVALVEAALCGIPMVSNHVGEVPLLWEDKDNILLVNNNNIDEYAKHVVSLFENKAIAESISISARKNAEKFDWSLIKKSWLSILKD